MNRLSPPEEEEEIVRTTTAVQKGDVRQVIDGARIVESGRFHGPYTCQTGKNGARAIFLIANLDFFVKFRRFLYTLNRRSRIHRRFFSTINLDFFVRIEG